MKRSATLTESSTLLTVKNIAKLVVFFFLLPLFGFQRYFLIELTYAGSSVLGSHQCCSLAEIYHGPFSSLVLSVIPAAVSTPPQSRRGRS